ncbi:MAG: hypothetical protein U0V87_00920 [Acidobacteriota bacterium]
MVRVARLSLWLCLLLVGCFRANADEAALRVDFDNFIWFRDDDLLQAIARAVPGFTGTLGETDPRLPLVVAALEARLASRALPGHVEVRLAADELTGGLVQRFRVTGADVVLCSVDVSGASAIPSALLREPLEPLIGENFSRAQFSKALVSGPIALLQRKGYAAAAVSELTLAPTAASDRCRGVKASAALRQGVAFKIAKPRWAGNRALTTTQLDATLPKDLNELADPAAMSVVSGQLRALYGALGHVDVRYKIDRQLQPQPPLLQLVIRVDEGPVFRMGRLTISGLDPASTRDLEQQWPVKPGTRYDERVLERFEHLLAASVKKRRGDGKTVFLQALKQPDRARAVVDVTLIVQ